MGELSTNIFLSNAEGEHATLVPLWNSHVIMELRRHLPEQTGEEKAEKRIQTMLAAFPKAMVRDWMPFMAEAESLVKDPDDAQIVAGAIAGRADSIVTENVSDFRRNEIADRLGIEVCRESAFLESLLNENPDWMLENLRAMTSALDRPPRNLRELYERMSKIRELCDFAIGLESNIRDSCNEGMERMFGVSSRGRQGRDARGRFTRAYGGYDGDLALPDDFNIWGPDGNGPVRW